MSRGLALLTAAALLGPVRPAAAQLSAARLPCKKEAARFCPGVAHGGGKLLACLRKQPQEEFSARCRKALGTPDGGDSEEIWGEGRIACGADAEKYCRQDARPLPCLRAHVLDISEGCRAHLKAAARGEKASRPDAPPRSLDVCSADFVRFCKGKDVPGRCLSRHLDALSDKCRAFVQKAGEPVAPKSRARDETDD